MNDRAEMRSSSTPITVTPDRTDPDGANACLTVSAAAPVSSKRPTTASAKSRSVGSSDA